MANDNPFSGLHILVAEDHPFQRVALARMLEIAGAAKIHVAGDGRAALAVLEIAAPPVDVVVCDLQMPGSDGMEFIRLLRDIPSPPPIVIVSALDPDLLASIAGMAQAYGINLLGIVEKPVTVEKLATLVASYKPPAAIGNASASAMQRFTIDEVTAGLLRNEFEPFFQPKIELSSGKVKGVEALARWRHPLHGIIEPGAFLSICEEGGLMDSLTTNMLDQAAQCGGAWLAIGIETCIAVNISARSLGLGLADHLCKLMQRHGLDPRHVILEVTESAAMIDVGRTLEALARLRMRGFGLSIDDYGTGYSSMLQLTRVAFTELKIDRSFVVSAATHATARIILASCIEMAGKLNMASVAEGVETQEQLDLLVELGCDMAQGYYFAKPMPACEYPDWVRSWSYPSAPSR